MPQQRSTKRPPKPIYVGRNGFQQALSEPGKAQGSFSKALENHQRAITILELVKREVPSWDEWKEEVGRTEDVGSVRKRIDKLRSRCTSDLERLYDLHAQDYFNEIRDRYWSKCELDPSLAAEVPEINGPKKEGKMRIEWANDYELVRYAYLSDLLRLKKRQIELEAKELVELRKQRQMFPQSKEQFDGKPTDVKTRVARFLVAEPARQEKMLNDFQWAWRQVKPLMEFFTKDEVFNAEVRALVIVADTQIARDPRKRLSGVTDT